MDSDNTLDLSILSGFSNFQQKAMAFDTPFTLSEFHSGICDQEKRKN
jgi:hypothetical protein